MSGKPDSPLRIFTARACAAPLEEAALLYKQKAGISVLVDACSRHCASPVAEEADAHGGHADFLDEIAEMGVHDLAIGGAEYLLDDGEVSGLILKGERRTIARRVSAIVTSTANPARVGGLADLGRPGVRVGISVIDCLKGVWEDVCSKAGVTDAVRRNIVFRANGCVAIVEAVAQGKVDAVFGWNTFAHLAEGRVSIVSLPRDIAVCRGTCVGLLKFTRQPETARAFMDFLTTEPARAIYRKFGWENP